MLQLQVPYLKPIDIDHAAAELLRDYANWKGAAVRPPVDVDEIVEGYFGLVLEVADLAAIVGFPDVLGATWLDDGCVRIDQSLEGKEGRFAFTVAHEIAHWRLHRPYHEMDKVTFPLFPMEHGGKPTPAIVCRAVQKKAPAEWQADQFAARILMPPKAVRETVGNLCADGPPAFASLEAARKAGGLVPELRWFADEVIEAGGFANVSNEAMCYRLLDLKLVKDTNPTQPGLL